MAAGHRPVLDEEFPVQSVLTDSLEKVLGQETPRPATPLDGVHVSGFLDELLSLQLAVRLDEGEQAGEKRVRLSGSAASLADAAVLAERIRTALGAESLGEALPEIPVLICPDPEEAPR